MDVSRMPSRLRVGQSSMLNESEVDRFELDSYEMKMCNDIEYNDV
jgi:hypothetical protein